jgi:hypothetical protein
MLQGNCQTGGRRAEYAAALSNTVLHRQLRSLFLHLQ